MRVAKAARLEVANNDNVINVISKWHSNSNSNYQHSSMQDKLSEMESLRSICAVVGARANFFSPRHLERVLASWPKEEDSTSYKTVADAINVFNVPLEQYWNNSRSDNNDRDVDSSDESDKADPYPDNDNRKNDEQGSNTDNVITSTSRAALQNVAEKCYSNTLEQENKELQEQQQEEQENEYRSKSNLLTNQNRVESICGVKSLGHKKLHYRIPHARFLSETFYPSRVDAMLSRGYHAYNFSANINDDNNNSNYCSSHHSNTKNLSERNITNTNRNKQGNDLIIAIDRKFGNGGKLFNIFTRSSALHQRETGNTEQSETEKYKENHGYLHKAQNNMSDKQQECIRSHDNNKEICWTNSLAKFIDAIPNAYERNLYVVVDENAPVDPYFDIDCHLPLNLANRPLNSSLNDDESVVALFCQEVMSDWFSVNLDNNDDDDDNNTDNLINVDNESDQNEGNITNQKMIDMDGSEGNDVEKEDSSNDASYARKLMWKVEELLHVILHYLRDIFEKSLKVKLKQCLVLTSSVAVCKHIKNTTTRSNYGNKKSNVFVNDNESTSTNRTTQPTHNSDTCNLSSNVANEQSLNDRELIDMKISFHVHFRFANNWVFTNVQELHRFMMKVRAQLDESILLYCHKLESANVDEVDDDADDDDDDNEMQRRAEVAALVRTCVDFGVYTRWRAFRLPYNVKCPLQTCDTITPSSWSSESSSSCFYSSVNANFANRNAQTLNLFAVEAAQQELYNCTGLMPPSHSIGASAPYCLSCIVLPTEVPVHNEEPESRYTPFSCNNFTLLDEQLETLRKAMYCFRFLLPLDPHASTFTNKKLCVFLETYTIRQELCQERNSTCTINNSETNVNDKNSQSNFSNLEEEKNKLAFVDAVFDMACIQRESINTNDGNNKNLLHRIRISKRLAPILESNYKNMQSTEEEQKQNEQIEEQEQEHEQLLELEQTHNKLSYEEQEQSPLERNGARQKSSVGRSPFSLERPPLPHSSRVLVYDRQIRSLVAEVFMCLSPLYGYHGQYQEEMENAITQFNKQYSSNNNSSKSEAKTMLIEHNTTFNDFDSVHFESISQERLTVQYEEAIRAYYVYQKQSRYCLQLNRLHRATYGQLYLTYGSIKVRCYSNDCCARCLIVPWSDPDKNYTESEKNLANKDKSDIDDTHENNTMQHDDNARHTTEINNTHVVNCQNEHFSSGVNGFVSPIHGYPKYDRLTAIRNALFPPLPADELLKRYGMSTLRAV